MTTLYDQLDQSVQLKRREKLMKATKLVGTIKARSPYGMILEGKDDEWLNFSKDEYVVGPMDKGVKKGDRVELVVDGKYVISCKKASGDIGAPIFGEKDDWDDAPPPEPPHESVQPKAKPSPDATGLWGYEQKDKLSLKQTCLNDATTILAAQIAAGLLKEPVTPDYLHAFAERLESLSWETFRG